MLVNRYVVFGAIVFFISIEEGQSLSCFNCNSYVDPECALDIVPEKFKIDCVNTTYVLCRKIKQVIDFEVNGLKANTRIIRLCGKQQEDPGKCYQRSGFGGRQTVCACQVDGCNSSSTIFMSTALLFSAFLLGKIAM